MKGFWIVAMLLIGGLLFWGLGSLFTPNNGDAEFQKMLEATEHVKRQAKFATRPHRYNRRAKQQGGRGCWAGLWPDAQPRSGLTCAKEDLATRAVLDMPSGKLFGLRPRKPCGLLV